MTLSLPSQPWFAALRSRDAAVRLFAILACGALLGMTAWQIHVGRNSAIAQMQVQGANLAKSVADQATSVMSVADVLLGLLADRSQEAGASQELFTPEQRSMVERVAGLAHVHVVAAYSVAGRLLAATPTVAVGLPAQLSAAELAFHRSHPGGDLLFGPSQRQSGTDLREIAVSRRFNGTDAQFGGVILALVNVLQAQDSYGGQRGEPLGSVGLMRQDGQLLARASKFEGDASETAALLGYQQQGFAGSYDVVSPVDGELRVASLRAVDGYPLVAFVTLNEAELLARWRSDALCAGLAAGLLSVGIAWFGWLLAKQIRRAEDVLQANNVQLQQTAMQDALTGIGNRRLFDGILQKEQRRAARTSQPLALLMIDVDHFKAFNDTYGHPTGDGCLRQVASTVARLAQRPADLAARFGGEEFAILLPETDAMGAVAIAERAQEAVRRLRIAHVGGLDGIVTVSIGVAVVWPQPLDGAGTDLVHLADAALYAAKAQGRNCWCLSPVSVPLLGRTGVAAWLSPQAHRSDARC